MVSESGGVRSLSRALEIAANFATLLAAVLLSALLVRNYFLPGSSSRPTQGQSVPRNPNDLATTGTDLSKRLAGVNWSANGRTVVLALSTYCHFCSESAPFFRRMREVVGKDVKLVGVFPQPVTTAETYLKREGVRLDQVRQVSLEQLGVAGTPTMLLVNGNGIVAQTWVGKLAPEKEGEALRIILGARSAAVATASYTAGR